MKGKTFIDVTLEHPEQYIATCKSKTLSNEATEYVEWVTANFDVDRKCKPPQLKIKANRMSPAANATSPSSAAACRHEDVHHRGSSAKYIKSTCKNCGATWQEERNTPIMAPEECPHKRTNHQGSNKHVKKTFCLDCGTYIDSVARDLAEELKDETPWRSKEEQVLLDSVSDHEHINREQGIAAAKLMVAECEQLDEGSYTTLSIANMFLDCVDRAITASDVRMTSNKRVAFAGREEERHAYVCTA